MLNVVALFGVLIILACAYGSMHPQALVSLVGRFANPAGLVFAVLVRVLMGVAAILAAPVSRSPGFLYVIGSIALLAAVVFLNNKGSDHSEPPQPLDLKELIVRLST